MLSNSASGKAEPQNLMLMELNLPFFSCKLDMNAAGWKVVIIVYYWNVIKDGEY